mgnify:FL=1
MRQYFIAGNWKMHKTIPEAVSLAEELRDALQSLPHRYLVAPPFTAISAVHNALEGSNIAVGAQNMASESSGAHTGEISPGMLKDAGATVVILGHSERRHTYGEDDALINKKVLLALSDGLEVILCVGETLEQREAGRVEEVVAGQLQGGLADVASIDNIVVAYEPVWAIGTGKTATPEDADAVHAFIRRWISDAYGQSAGESLVIQYGGSVKPANVAALMAKEHIDGALVGGASLSSDSFSAIAAFDKT